MNGRKKLWKDTPARALRGERPKSPDSAYSNFEEISQNGSDDEYAEHPIPAKRSQKKQHKTAKRSRKNPGEVMPAPSPEAGPSTRTTGAFGQYDQSWPLERFLRIMQEVPEKPAPSEKYSTPVAWTDVPDVGQTNEGSESLHIAAIKHKAFVLQRLANAEGECFSLPTHAVPHASQP
ncbi:hypothetical protein EV122DRAFT_227123 [Schizophyllum commune]